MPPLTLDGVVHPDEYEVRVDGSAHPVTTFPEGAPVFIEVYYSFDGSAIHFGVRRTGPYRITGLSFWIDADRNGCELGDLLVAVQPPDRLVEYGIFEAPGKVKQVAGSPPEPPRAGVALRSFEEGDTEISLDLVKQYANGLMNPLPEEMNVNVTVRAMREDGTPIVNYLRDAPIQTFVIHLE